MSGAFHIFLVVFKQATHGLAYASRSPFVWIFCCQVLHLSGMLLDSFGVTCF